MQKSGFVLTLVLLFTVPRLSWYYHDLWWGIGTQLYLVVGQTYKGGLNA